MKNNNMRKLLYLSCLPVLMLWASCKKELPDYGNTATVKMSNGWWVNLYEAGNLVTAKPIFFDTYNTAGNNDSLWLDDLTNGYGFKCKVKIDYNAMTFSGASLPNDYFDGTPAFPATVTINNGKVLAGAGHSRKGNVTDSLYMEAVFSDDPGETWKITGTARTGIKDDDY